MKYVQLLLFCNCYYFFLKFFYKNKFPSRTTYGLRSLVFRSHCVRTCVHFWIRRGGVEIDELNRIRNWNIKKKKKKSKIHVMSNGDNGRSRQLIISDVKIFYRAGRGGVIITVGPHDLRSTFKSLIWIYAL